MNKILLIITIIAVGILAAISSKYIKLKTENDMLSSNQYELLDRYKNAQVEVQSYKVRDSLNAAQTTALQLTLKEYKAFRAEDAALIAQLKGKLSKSSTISTTETKTEYALKTEVRDSIIHDTIPVTCFEYYSKWVDVSGCVNELTDSIELSIATREALKIIETIEYKRFLGFLWKTNKVKKQSIDIVSENPNTQIMSVELVKISK